MRCVRRYDLDGKDVAASIYYGLFALQHRGQESCGIAVTDTYGQRKVLSKKGLGHVDDVFKEDTLAELKGNWESATFGIRQQAEPGWRMPSLLSSTM